MTAPAWLVAGAWAGLAGSALLLGAALTYAASVPRRVVAWVMAFGGGVLVAALASQLMEEAWARGGLDSAALGFLAGAALFSGANVLLARHGAKHRKRSRGQPGEDEAPGSGLAIALGSLLDGVPESVAIGASAAAGGAALPVAAAIFLSNVPEGLSGAAGMRRAGRSGRYIFGLWGGIAIASALAGVAGDLALRGATGDAHAVVLAFAAGAVLAMLADTMMPEAFEEAHAWTGLLTVAGFLAAFALAKASP